MTYAITLPDGTVKEYKQLNAAIDFAQKTAVADGVELEVVEVESESLAKTVTPVQGRHFHAFERVQDAPFSAPHIEGYRLAYTRKRIQSAAYRAIDKSHWLYVDGRTGGRRKVKNTKQGTKLFHEMAQGLTL